jgi:hypothetical protein
MLHGLQQKKSLLITQPAQEIENLEDLEEDGEVYDSIEDIWPDYPSKEDFFFNEEEY